MTVRIDRLDWWCDECLFGEALPSEEETIVRGKLHEDQHKNTSLGRDKP